MIIRILNVKWFLIRIMGAVIIGIVILPLLIGVIKKEKIINDDAVLLNSSKAIEIGTDLIAKYETKYNESNLNRSENVKLAAKKVNDTIVMPGDTFSFNDTVGVRSEENGFKLATVYQNGKVGEGFGGGVCQVSSTLYNAVLYANLQVVERKGHLFLPAYIHPGGDATVAEGYVDFKFKNSRKEPIKIKCSANDGVISVYLYGKKQEEDCSIEIKSMNTEILQYKTVYETDENMQTGEQETIQMRKKRI